METNNDSKQHQTDEDKTELEFGKLRKQWKTPQISSLKIFYIMAENTAHAKVSQTKFLQESFISASFYNPRPPPTRSSIV
ncbi:hypothetical protein N9049_01290 [bacterium]|nr:hypothetical protein [bacterium]